MLGWRFSSSPVKVLSTVALLAVFVMLGVWQLNRAQEKTRMRDNLLARANMPAVDVGPGMLDPDSMVFRTAVASGRFLREYQILLDNQVLHGRAGYHVLTPMLPSGGGALLLVNRGWVPWGADRSRLPEVEAPPQRVRIRGRLAAPAHHALSFEKEVDGFQRVWQNLDLERYSQVTGYPVQGLVLLLSPDDPSGDGLERQWPAYEDAWIARHRGYALQWFGLAITLSVIFVFFSLHRKGRRDAE